MPHATINCNRASWRLPVRRVPTSAEPRNRVESGRSERPHRSAQIGSADDVVVIARAAEWMYDRWCLYLFVTDRWIWLDSE